MSFWGLETNLKDIIRDEIFAHLQIQTNWVGDPATSVFGIEIRLLWDNTLIRSTTVDFIGKTFD